MRKTYRDRNPSDYWQDRWAELPADSAVGNHDRYPFVYANEIIGPHSGTVLELGCGPGRLVRYYWEQGINIIGVDNIPAVVSKLHHSDHSLRLVSADARALPFVDGQFDAILCFGVYHSIEENPSVALDETHRVLRQGGRLCAEFRADSIHNRLIDSYKARGRHTGEFHKWNYRRHEARRMLVRAGFEVEQEIAALNMSMLYHIPLLRDPTQRNYDQHVARSNGYRLRQSVELLQSFLLRTAPEQSCNLHIFICRKP